MNNLNFVTLDHFRHSFAARISPRYGKIFNIQDGIGITIDIFSPITDLFMPIIYTATFLLLGLGVLTQLQGYQNIFACYFCFLTNLYTNCARIQVNENSLNFFFK